MKHPVRDALNRRRFTRMKAKALSKGLMVCAVTNARGKPVYFSAPVGSTDSDLEARAFHVRNQRDISTGERMLQSAAKSKPIAGGR